MGKNVYINTFLINVKHFMENTEELHPHETTKYHNE